MLVTSDLHGNLADFQRMVALFQAEEDAVLVSLGDLFHGPSIEREEWERECEHLGDWYADESAQVFREMVALTERYPGRVTSLLGNHEHGHIGGPVVAKFYPDEALAMEATMGADEVPRLHAFIRSRPLVATTPCGVVLIHGAAPTAEFDRQTLATVELDGYRHLPPYKMYERGFLGQLLWRRYSTEEETYRFLQRLSAAGVNGPCNVAVHGHEVVWEGHEIVNEHLVNLSTSFGMRAADKTYLRVELDGEIPNAAALAEGRLHKLYPS